MSHSQTTHDEAAVSAHPPLDVARMAQAALSKAVDSCVRKMGLASREEAVERLRQGDGDICDHLRYGLAHDVGQHLGTLDEKVKAVYLYDYGGSPDDICPNQTEVSSLVHLIVWTEQKTAALNALVHAMDQALVHRYAELVDMPSLRRMLDVHLVDDADVEACTGYGVLLFSIHTPPLQVWQR